MKAMIHYPETGKDPMGVDFDIISRVGEYLAYDDKTYRVDKIVHCPTYDDEHSRIRIHLVTSDD